MWTYSKPNKTQLYFFDLAKQEAQKSPMRKSKHGAVLVQGGKVLFKGYNYDFGQKMMHGQYSLHAEVNVILQGTRAKLNFKGVNIYVVRLGHDGKLWSSKPCKNCQKLINKCCIDNVFYSER